MILKNNHNNLGKSPKGNDKEKNKLVNKKLLYIFRGFNSSCQ